MTKHCKILLFTILCSICTINMLQAQQAIQKNGFTYVPTINNQAVLLTEIPLRNISEAAKNYTKLRNWVKENFTTDLINSSIIYYPDDDAILVKSKVDLLLPILNSQNVSEKSLLTYSLYLFIRNGICVMQVSDMEYKVSNAIPKLKNKVTAESFVTNDALKIQDSFQKERIETQKGTLYFFNQLVQSLDRTLNSTTTSES